MSETRLPLHRDEDGAQSPSWLQSFPKAGRIHISLKPCLYRFLTNEHFPHTLHTYPMKSALFLTQVREMCSSLPLNIEASLNRLKTELKNITHVNISTSSPYWAHWSTLTFHYFPERRTREDVGELWGHGPSTQCPLHLPLLFFSVASPGCQLSTWVNSSKITLIQTSHSGPWVRSSSTSMILLHGILFSIALCFPFIVSIWLTFTTRPENLWLPPTFLQGQSTGNIMGFQ